jgi:plasmid maintenance system antidote protein VapI
VRSPRQPVSGAIARRPPFFGTSPEFWMNLQAMHDLTKARRDVGKTIERDIRPRAA